MKRVHAFFEKKEFVIFCIIAILNGLYVFAFKFYHTLDGPGHLHNSNMLINILSGNELISEYYRISTIPVGNWTGNAILSFYNYLFPAPIALSFFIFTYFTGMAFSYRYLIKSLTGKFSPVNYIMFPFFDNACLNLGLYNYSTSLIILFFILGFWIKHNQKMNFGLWIRFSFLLILLYFSHFLSYVFFGIFLILYLIYDEFFKYRIPEKIIWKNIWIKMGRLALASLPSIIFALIYVINIISIVNSGSRDDPEQMTLLQNFFYIRPLILFHVENDGTRNIILFAGLMVLFLMVIFQGIFKRDQLEENKYNRGFVLVLLIFFTTLLLLLPSRFLLNTMRIRVALMFFMVFVIWLSMYRYKVWMQVLAAIFFIGITVHNKAAYFKARDKMDKYANEIYTLNNWIKPNSIVLPLKHQSMWMYAYSLSYIGIDKPIVNLKNEQAFGFFNIVYNDNLPSYTLGKKSVQHSKLTQEAEADKDQTKIVDYVIIVNPNKPNSEYEIDSLLNSNLSAYYSQIIVSPLNNFVLFERNLKTDNQND